MNTTHLQQTTTQGTRAAAPLQLAPAAQNLASSPTLAVNEAIAERRAAGREVIHLGFGEATFPLHPLLQAALAEAAKHTGYFLGQLCTTGQAGGPESDHGENRRS